MKTYKKLLQVAAAGVLTLAAGNSAQAVGTATILVNGALVATDEGAGDTVLGTTGLVGWSGTAGGFTIVVTNGTTKPLSGSSAGNPFMDLGVTASRDTSASPDTVTIDFIDTGWTTSLATAIASFSVNDHGSSSNITFSTFLNGSLLTSQNTLLDLTTMSTNSAPGALNGTNYTLDLKFVVKGGPSESFSLDGNLKQTAPDGGLTVSLLGGAMVGLVGLRRKLRMA